MIKLTMPAKARRNETKQQLEGLSVSDGIKSGVTK
jgi:hypothetical protein